ncbi:transposase [Acidovorax sp. SUPP3334]|uniref:transposase n=1 Tax=Acidovorax sp. SUPP3334 TaxID=2920881 RepID=UPI0023DE2E0D|nr:transposase [Acidovorax sp. SUPP3334]GKT27144.1 transposase [Acidovorax sp. SUPP3334]
MSEWILDLAERLIVGRKRDGRCVYDAQAKQELISACGRPGISMAKLARDCGINANLLSTWVRKHERKAVVPPAPAVVAAVATVATAPAFVPVHIEAPAPQAQAMLQMQARLPSGVVVDLGACDLPQACELLEALGRMRCSASTRT